MTEASKDSQHPIEDDMVFEVFIQAPMESVWNELTKTHEVQKAVFNAQMHTTELGVGAPIRMRSPNGKYTAVAGEVLEFEKPLRFSHTFRFTQYDDPDCEVLYELEQQDDGTRFRLTVRRAPTGTKTAKQMKQGGTMICNTLKAVLETGSPTFGIRLLYGLFGLLAPFTPKRCATENWPLTTN